MTTISDRLLRARRRDFVGREREQSVFRAALEAEELPFLVLDVHGPGGVGKTALLWRFHAMAGERDIPCFQLDGEEVGASPAAFRAALEERGFRDPLPADRPIVLLLDGFERLVSLDPWMRGVFLPGLPVNVLTVRASSVPPSPGWRSDPGWSALHEPMPLRNLGPLESRDLLLRKGVPEEHHDAILQFCHGHPLAMTLVADLILQNPEAGFQPDAAPDVVGPLLERILGECPGPEHRLAVEACAVTRVMTQPLLQEMLETADGHVLFEWLRGLSFAHSRSRGLQLHDLARGALEADLRWRDPDRHRRLVERARRFYAGRLADGSLEVVADYLFLHRAHPLVSALLDEASSAWDVSRARPDEGPALEALARDAGGPAAAEIVAAWLPRQPEAFLAVRDAGGAVRALLMGLALERTEPDDVPDPAVRAARRHLEERAPLRPGERATLFRWWTAEGGPARSRILLEILRHALATPDLAFTMLAVPESEAFGDMPRLPGLDYTSEGRAHAVLGQDWRAVPPGAWLDGLGKGSAAAAPPEAPARPVLALSRSAFEEAVRQGLRDYDAPGSLMRNPVLRSRLVLSECGPDASEADRVAALRRVLREATDSLQFSRRQVKFHKALHHTYIEPAGTQEQVSEQIDVPFSSYRRHLKSGMDRVAEILWHREISTT